MMYFVSTEIKGVHHQAQLIWFILIILTLYPSQIHLPPFSTFSSPQSLKSFHFFYQLTQSNFCGHTFIFKSWNNPLACGHLTRGTLKTNWLPPQKESTVHSSALCGGGSWASPCSIPECQYLDLTLAATSLWIHKCNGLVLSRKTSLWFFPSSDLLPWCSMNLGGTGYDTDVPFVILVLWTLMSFEFLANHVLLYKQRIWALH